eukprot:TRINITY_DN387_c0_g1_i1.p1 TRINITY_DN387_c0_g1~~TRINITY_DN387_c0_g1_i1.p1  ORF type:complete len:205 (-),score=77.14 TRINITY_DN387_c0_g1_i1:193-807(-)
MGVLRSIVNVLVASIGIFIFFTAHNVYQFTVPAPSSPSIPDWPVSYSKEKINGLLKERQPIIEAMKNFDSKSDWKSLLTEDASLETPLFSISGRENFLLALDTFSKHKNEFRVTESLGEYHNAQEILLEWNVKWGTKALGSYTQLIRFRVFVEPSNKVFKIVEEWNGSSLLNEKTTLSFIGKFHSKFRSYMGQLLLTLIKNKIL